MFVEKPSALLEGFVRIKKEEIFNDLVWFGVLSQGLTAGAIVEGVLETLANWEEIRDDFGMGYVMQWVGVQPAGKDCTLVTPVRSGDQSLQEGLHECQGQGGASQGEGCHLQPHC